jgi:propanol-preferring alcohol dehydrogenase
MVQPEFKVSGRMMRAMRIHQLGSIESDSEPLVADEVPIPVPRTGELLLEIRACGVCRTELDEIEGRTPPPTLPVIPGHQVIGEVVQLGPGCRTNRLGQRVGVAWIHSACGQCDWCRRGLENLCPGFRACGRDAHGGYAEFMTIGENFCYPLPDALSDDHAAPLLCAGAVGYRALRLCGIQDGDTLGLTGFGASAHLVLQMARYLYPASQLLVFARNPAEREFALELGADWAGDTMDHPSVDLSAIIDTTPAWRPVLAALERLQPGGRLVINAIRKEPHDQEVLQDLDYASHLWREKQLRSVANVTRLDVRQCLELAAAAPLQPEVTGYPLEQANLALRALKAGTIRGAKVLQIKQG